tara:strand:+ start:365 stop:580 length:216 start_codon:yes stop_codon:yes gene_type:complete
MVVVNLNDQPEIRNTGDNVWNDEYHLMNSQFSYQRRIDQNRKKCKKILCGITAIIVGYGMGIMTCYLGNIC